MGKILSVGGLAAPNTSLPVYVPFTPISDGKRHAQRQCFAIVRALSNRLDNAGLSDTALWNWVKGVHSVSSRSELSELQWVVLSARLSSAQRDRTLFDNLCDAVRTHHRQTAGTCRVYRHHLDGTGKKLYDGVITPDIKDRCQRHADASGCDVHLHIAADVKIFIPTKYPDDPSTPPVPEFRKDHPARAFEYQQRGNETHRVEIQFPDTSDLHGWGQQHANETGHCVHITDRMGHYTLMRFTPNNS